MAKREIPPEAVGDDKPTDFYENEEAQRRLEGGLESELRAKRRKSLAESIGDAIDHQRQDQNHRADS